MPCLSGFELYSRWVPLVVVYCSTSSLFTPLESLFSIRFPNHHIFFANLLLYPSECNNLCTVFWLKVFVLHLFSFAVMSCKVSSLLLLTKLFNIKPLGFQSLPPPVCQSFGTVRRDLPCILYLIRVSYLAFKYSV